MLKPIARMLVKGLPADQELRFRRWLHRVSCPARAQAIRKFRPVSNAWGFDRGTPIDRYYIEQFLSDHRPDIQGHVLEVKDSAYAKRLGTRLERIDVLDIDTENPKATLIADLAHAECLPSNSVDCFILTQTLQFIYENESAVRHSFRMLRPGGVLLATVPSLSRLVPCNDIDYWRYTPASCQRLAGAVFGPGNVIVHSYGNLWAGIAFLTGMAVEDFSTAELDVHDENFPVLVGLRAVKGTPADVETGGTLDSFRT